MHTCRPVRRQDYPGIAQIRSAFRPEPVTAEMVASMTARVQRTCEHWLHEVAVTDDLSVIGEVMAMQENEAPPGEWVTALGVLPEHRGRGIGTELYSRAEAFARETGARLIRFRVAGTQEAGFQFAVSHGFTLERLPLESVLNLAEWDGARFGKQVASVRASGIRLLSLPSLTGDGLLHQIYDLEMETLEEAPTFAGHLPPYEVWAREHTAMQPGEQFCTLALDGERLVGVSTVYLPPEPGLEARQGYTAVRRVYRGRGIALALKLVNIKECKARGATCLRTNTDPDQTAAQAVNAKLGFREVPGPRVMVKTLCD